MSATEGFWPGEAPASEEEDDVQEPEVAEPVGWPQPREHEQKTPKAESEPEPAATAVAEPEPQPEAEPEAGPEAEKPETAVAQHIPGELDIPEDVAVLEG